MHNSQQHKFSESPQSNTRSAGKKSMALPDNRCLSNPVQRKANSTGLPDDLKSGIENLSGHSMDDVKVHYNSSSPAQLNAHAYAQGTNIHLAPGQEKHLPHEAWHVVQQKQGRVKPTTQLKSKVNVNDDHSLEKEADLMGAKALQKRPDASLAERSVQKKSMAGTGSSEIVQRFGVVPNLGGIVLSMREQDKWNKVVADVTALGVIKNIPGMNVNLNLVHTGGTNPAVTNPVGANIQVQLQDWFLDQSSAAETVALITHELAAHYLSEHEMTPAQRAQEIVRAGNNFNMAAGGHNLTLGATRTPTIGLGALDGQRLPNDRRQEDHVNVGRDDGTAFVHPAPPPPAANVSVRARKYTETMLAQGDAIWNRGGAPGPTPEKIEDLREYLETYLFDVARIMATDDGQAGAIFRASPVIADVMNWYHGVIVARYGGTHAWLNHPDLQVNKNGWDIAGMLLSKVGDYISSRIATSRVGRSMVGRILRPVAGAVGNVVGGVVKGAAHIGSGVIRAGVALRHGNFAQAGSAFFGGLARGIASPFIGLGKGAYRLVGDTVRGISSLF